MMASSTLDTDVEADGVDLPPAGFKSLMTPSLSVNSNSFFTDKPGTKSTRVGLSSRPNWTSSSNLPTAFTKVTHPAGTETTPQPYIQATQDICDEMIEDGAHVVFDWDNTLKLYNRETRQLSCRVSKQFLLHLKHDRHCRLYIISAIRPSALNLSTILSEVDKLGLTDVFVSDSCDSVDGPEPVKVVKDGEYAHKGNIIICGYDKAETFLKLSSFDSSRGDKVMFFDDEIVNINNFSVLVPNSMCYLCE